MLNFKLRRRQGKLLYYLFEEVMAIQRIEKILWIAMILYVWQHYYGWAHLGVCGLQEWNEKISCMENNLTLNTLKTKELVV